MRQEKAPAHVTRAMLEVVENQIKDGKPAETRITLKRLQDSGITRPDGIRLIACLIANEIFNVMKNGEEYNEHRFVANLKKLPELPWE